MYAQKHFNRDLELLSIPPQPAVNSLITYRRNGRLLTGKLLGTHWYEVQRHRAIVCEYIVAPLPGQSNLSFNVVGEDEIVWSVKPVCPRCGGAGFLSIVGDDAVDCPVCGFTGDEAVY